VDADNDLNFTLSKEEFDFSNFEFLCLITN